MVCFVLVSHLQCGLRRVKEIKFSCRKFFCLALIQYLFYVLFYQRFIEDTLLNFIDLCSVSNISVFMLTDNLYGYYIHGRSPHGTTDVNMKDMILNLERESKQMIGTRGLQAKSDEQTFIVKIGPSFRRQYDILLGTYRVKNFILYFIKERKVLYLPMKVEVYSFY